MRIISVCFSTKNSFLTFQPKQRYKNKFYNKIKYKSDKKIYFFTVLSVICAKEAEKVRVRQK